MEDEVCKKRNKIQKEDDELLKAKVLDNEVLIQNSICNTISIHYLKRKKLFSDIQRALQLHLSHFYVLRKILENAFHQHCRVNHTRGCEVFSKVRVSSKGERQRAISRAVGKEISGRPL